VISVAEVRVRYGTMVALDGVTERAAPGEWLGVIGPNGAGKTTLLQAVARQVRHLGRIEVCAQPIAGMSRRKLARLVAYVPQRPQLPPDMTVGDYVLLGRTPHIGYLRVETDTDRRICTELIDRLALSEMADRALRTLSGGELQRLVLARALAQQAPVLLLDEPTSALDLGRRVDALELVDEIRRERSLTILSAVHDLTLAGQFADRLLLLDAGRVAASGPPASVLRDDVLRPHFGPGVQVLTAPNGDLAVTSRRPERRATPTLPDRRLPPAPVVGSTSGPVADQPSAGVWSLLRQARLLQVIVAAARTTKANRPAVLACACYLIEAVAIAFIPFLGGLAGAAAATFVLGGGNGLGNVIFVTLVQRWAPPRLLGRVMSVVMLAGLGSFPLSVAVSGVLVRHLGPSPFFPVAGAVVAAAVLGALSQREFRDFGTAGPATAELSTELA